jgi:hypothetical protein
MNRELRYVVACSPFVVRRGSGVAGVSIPQFAPGTYRAERHATAALELYRAIGARLDEAIVLCCLAEVALASAALASARQYAQQALSLFHASKGRPGIFKTWNLLARIADAEGNADEANRCRLQAQYIQAELRQRR